MHCLPHCQPKSIHNFEGKRESKIFCSALLQLPGEPYLLLVLFEDVELVAELLRGLQRDRQQQQHVIHPGHHALRLVAVKPATWGVQTGS